MAAWAPTKNPYLDLGASYGGQWGNAFPTAPIARDYIQNQNGVAYSRQIAPFGGGLDPYGRFVQGQEGRVEDAYLGAVAQNPNLRRDEFMRPFDGNYFAKLWQSLGARGRGENPGNYAARARWQRFG